MPARREHLAGLPDAWIGVGDLDLFLDEDRAYAERLEDAGAQVQLRVEPGMYHGADYCTWSAAMRSFRSDAIDALRRGLANGS
nr:alpha/beta hydrolase [Actinomyces ruminis]